MTENKVLLEYIWIDFDSNPRSKIKILEKSKFNTLNIPEWNFDGSSTGQAEGKDSDVILRPCISALYPNPFVNYMEAYLVLCECYNKDGTPHETNHRVKLSETYLKCTEQEPIFGIEQEYVIFERENSKGKTINDICDGSSFEINTPKPYKWIEHDEPGFGQQGPYYCGVGGGVCFGREISEKHLELCLKAGLEICGTNAEVMGSQWEYQIGPLEPVKLSDQMWISRYILHKISELYSCVISFHPKPYKGNWNGSGGHTNFSTKQMREKDGIEEIKVACEKLSRTHKSHMKVYGKYNEQRLTGLHETSSIDKFSWGISNRGCSIRIPLNVNKDGCGYLEDRRPASNLDPYLVCEKICSTVCLNNY
jgi:glutamine synthetase